MQLPKLHPVALAFVVMTLVLVPPLYLAVFWEHATALSSPPAEQADNPSASTSAHGHQGNLHFPNIQSFGDYHVEAEINRKGDIQILFYGQKEKQLMPIPTLGSELWLETRVVLPGEDGIPVTLKPRPYPGEPEGYSSRFVGSFPRTPAQNEVGLTLTFPFAGNTYRVQWRPVDLMVQRGEGVAGTGHEPAMPVAATQDEADQLFLTPAGRYTRADIEANGRTTAAQKYAGIMAKHNANPPPGSRICPITTTGADQRFAWIIDGKTYTFCCPPCIEEFVRKAKEAPDSIAEPESYIKK